MQRPDVLIVGGGAVGAACARGLARHKLSVLVIDDESSPGIATRASAGMLAPLAETRHEDPMLALSVRARDYYQELVPVLEEETGIEIGLWTEGILQLAYSEDDVTQLKSDIAWQRQQGFNSDWLAEDDLRELSPGLSAEVIGAMLAPEDGALEPEPLVRALLEDAARHGAMIERGRRVEAIDVVGRRVNGVRIGSETLAAGAVLVAAGCWSGRIGGLPRPLSVEPIRGQMVALEWPDAEPPAIIYGRRGYLMRRGNEALAGSTMEHAGFDVSTTDEGIAHILATAQGIFPALAGAVPVRTWAGLRPGSPDDIPLVGPDPGVSGLWYATGHGRNGILLAGLTGDIIARMMTNQPIELTIDRMDPGRFWRL